MPGETQVSKPALVKGVMKRVKPLGWGLYSQATAMVASLKDVGHGFQERGFFVGDVAPEEELAVEGLEVGDDLLHEVEVDGAEALGVYVGLGLAFAEVDGLVGAEVEEGRRVDGG